MQLEHYTAEPVTWQGGNYAQHDDECGVMKPRGLWVSVAGEYDWPTWCRAEEFNLDKLACRYVVTLAPGANILLLDTIDKLDEFASRYPNPYEFPDGIRISSLAIDWLRVTREYDGIIISPYHWTRRLDLMWYYSWDCASGCIWNASAIASVELAPPLLESPALPAPLIGCSNGD